MNRARWKAGGVIARSAFGLARRPASLRAAISLALVVILAWPAMLFREYLGSLDRRADDFQRADAIVSLAGAAGRLGRGLDLLEQGKGDVLLLSGTGKGASLKSIFPDRDLTQLEQGQVILLESRSTSTWENAIEAWAVLSTLRTPDGGERRVHDIVLLTSNYHMLRSEYVFRRAFPDDVTIHVYPVEAENVARGKWWRDSKARRIVLQEYGKYLWYRMRY